MNVYKKSQIQVKNKFSFWNAFQGQERFFMYNPQTKICVMGAGRLKAVPDVSTDHGAPYVFSTMSFSQKVKDGKWHDLGNENVIYRHYFVEKDGVQTLYQLLDEEQGEKNPQLELVDTPSVHIEHLYNEYSGDYDQWKRAFTNIKEEIESGRVRKVVLSRELVLECDTTICTESVLHNLMCLNPESFVFAYGKNQKTFLGASPEILVQKESGKILSHALAGTLPRYTEKEKERISVLLKDRKNREEHQIVVEEIVNVFKEFDSNYSVGKTDVVSLKNIHHLLTPIYASDERSVSEWARRLHPTPAMGGYPVKVSKSLIEKYEIHERGLYSAPIGLIEKSGDGVFIAGIRSALICENMIYAYAGCGIVNESECLDEYMETTYKLKTILESL